MNGRRGVRSPWRLQARPIIATVIESHPAASEPELQTLLDAALPWPRDHNATAYPMWRDECKAQIDLRRKKVNG